ncbi:hypothetical protein DPMN_068415 [Dreissena polymorpha]|uniref:Uncharacterized protein n=1 Tax=Dreissena polymorpha TaxID=45954 RepID=A0A9D3Z147_DREPO|nr:hypothetical protein DPMN_068415 [Dreissena polymorpha]
MKTAATLAAITNLRTKFHEDWTINVTSRVLTSKAAPPPGGHIFQQTGTIFKLSLAIIRTHVLTNFHEDWTKNVTPRVLTNKTAPPLVAIVRALYPGNKMFTCFHYTHIDKTAPPPGGHVFSLIWTIFELVRDINKTNILTKFHDDWAKIVTSRVFTRNTALPPGSHVFKRTKTIFEFHQHIIKTNILTK